MPRLTPSAMLLTLVPLALPAQAAGPATPLMTVAEEVALARSAAPQAVSGAATVHVLTADGYRVAAEGTSGVACFVDRSRPGSREPHCFDAEGARTILPIRMHEMRLRQRGVDEAAIDADVALRLRRGEFTLPTRPVMSYMMSSGQELVSDDGRAVGAWKPHLMIYHPYLTAEMLGLPSQPDGGAVMVFNSGDALASLVVVVPEFAERPAAGGQ